MKKINDFLALTKLKVEHVELQSGKHIARIPNAKFYTGNQGKPMDISGSGDTSEEAIEDLFWKARNSRIETPSANWNMPYFT